MASSVASSPYLTRSARRGAVGLGSSDRVECGRSGYLNQQMLECRLKLIKHKKPFTYSRLVVVLQLLAQAALLTESPRVAAVGRGSFEDRISSGTRARGDCKSVGKGENLRHTSK